MPGNSPVQGQGAQGLSTQGAYGIPMVPGQGKFLASYSGAGVASLTFATKGSFTANYSPTVNAGFVFPATGAFTGTYVPHGYTTVYVPAVQGCATGSLSSALASGTLQSAGATGYFT